MPGARQMNSMNAKGDNTVSSMDRQFMMKATQGNLAEVKTGQLALQKSKDASVRQVAQRLITDHTKAQQQLTSLAQSLHVTLPSALSEEQRATYAKWSKLSGNSFDTSYLSGQMHDHATTISLFQKEVKSGSNPAVKAWAQKTLPVLSNHAMHVKQAAQRQGNPTAAGRQSAASSNPMQNH
jgi:putative membrane protein